MESNNSIEPEQLLSKVNPSNLGEEASNTAIAPPISGLYAWNAQQIREELRLDVDGRYPQMVASGTIISNLSSPIHWIAKLTNNGPNTWTGNIRNKFLDGVQSFPYTNVKIQVTRGSFSVQHTAEVTFLIGGKRTELELSDFNLLTSTLWNLNLMQKKVQLLSQLIEHTPIQTSQHFCRMKLCQLRKFLNELDLM